jgi:hypothetical protein
LQSIVERPCKPGADQIVEMLVMFATANPACGGQKFCHSLPANVFSNAGMKNFNGTIIDFTANCPDAVAIGTRFIAQAAQEFRALCWQSERDGNHEMTARFLQKATEKTKAVIDLVSLRYLRFLLLDVPA